MTAWRFAWAVWAFLVLLAPGAGATEAQDKAYDDRLIAELTARDPEHAPLFVQANEAREHGDAETASALYEQVRQADPWFSAASRRRCGEELKLGNVSAAVALCRDALAHESSGENESSLALALAADESATIADLAEADAHGARAEQMKPDDRSVLLARVQVSLRRNDTPTFRRCVERLDAIAPDDLETLTLHAVLAMNDGKEDEARATLDRAHARGMSDDDYVRLNEAVTESVPLPRRVARIGARAAASWFGVFGLLMLAGYVLSKVTLKAVSRVPAEGGEPTTAEALVRKIYRAILWLCCAFYYASIPLLIATILLFFGGVVYAMLAMGFVSLKLLAVAGILAFATIAAIFKAIFVRVRDVDPGKDIELADHPRFRAVVREVASRIGTRAVDRVYLTPFTDVAVTDRGGIFEQLSGQSQRCLILGAGVLDGMNVRAFKSVLAHEYGHFKNEDTAGGGFALAVRRSLLTMTVHLLQRGAASAVNPAWWFVRGFWRLFLTISQGASRLQEVLADRWAALAYGSESFEKGLRHVVERSVRFDAHLAATLDEVVPEKRALSNLYTYAPAKAPTEADLETKVKEAIDVQPSPYDSHPAPADRLAWVHALSAKGVDSAAGDDDLVWSLFEDRQAIELLMTDDLRERVRERRGVNLPKEAVTED